MVELAVIYLELPDGRLVLQRRTQDAPTAPGLLGFFGGHVEAGEDPLTAVKREVAEETSLNPEDLGIEPFGNQVLQKDGDYPKERHTFYFKGYIKNTDFEVYEGDRAEVFTLEEALQNDLTAGVRKKLEAIAKDK